MLECDMLGLSMQFTDVFSSEKGKDMKCLILAAGYATRMYPLTENFPKPLLPVKGKPILDWLIDDISGCGINDFVVVTNHKFADQFREWAESHGNGNCLGEDSDSGNCIGKNHGDVNCLGEDSDNGKCVGTGRVNIRVVDDGTSTNETRLGAVRDIQLGATDDDDYLVIAGDNLLDFSLGGFIEFFKEKKAPCVMTHEENDLVKQQRTAIITFEDDGKITSYEEKPQQPKGNHAVPPFYCYRGCDLEMIASALEDGCGYDAPGSFAAWLAGRMPVYAWKMPGKRIDIGTLEGYEAIK